MPGTAGRKARLLADVCISARSLHSAPARESGLERCFHTDSSREFMDPDCAQQGILFSDERKNIQQPVFALGVLDTLPCFGIRHMQVVGVKLLSAGQKHSSPPRVPVEGGGESPEGLRTAPAPRGEERQPPTAWLPLRPHPHPPPTGPQAARLPPRPAASAPGQSSGEPAPAWGALTASPVEYCISWL